MSNSIKPKFNNIPSLCLNETSPILQLISNNGISGSWSPSSISTNSVGTFNYTFTPDDPNQCGQSVTLSVTITSPASPPSFIFPEICVGSILPPLPKVSLEGVSGTWSPETISTDKIGINTYIFTPSPGQCVQPLTEKIEVIDKIIPAFDPIGPLCLNSEAVALPTTSKNGITGTWTPSTVSTKVPGKFNYTFVPESGLCAVSVPMEIEIYNESR